MWGWYHGRRGVAILPLMSPKRLENTPSVSKIGDALDDDTAWEIAEKFDELKFDRGIKEEWQRTYANNPSYFFSDEIQSSLKTMPPERRLVLLARASLHITTSPSLVEKHFLNYPQDKAAAAALVTMHDGIAQDGITHTLFGVIWGLIKDVIRTESLRGARRNGGQYDEIFERRRLAPRFLLKNHQEGGVRWERFGGAEREYVTAARKAHELAVRGDELLDTSRVFANDAYVALPAQKKAELLRMGLADMQFSLVFDETFNSAFTRATTERWNAQESQRGFNPGHSMLFGTRQPWSAYHHTEDYFDWAMNNTAAHGGDIEEYAHHKLLLAVLREFPNVSADKDVNTDVLVDFWVKNRNPIFATATVNAIKSQDAIRAGELLLDALRKGGENKSALVYVLRQVNPQLVVKHVVEITKLLQGEDSSERFLVETCALVHKQGTLDPAEIEGAEIIVVPGGSFKGALRNITKQMLRIQREQYGSEGAGYDIQHPELFVALERALKERIENPEKKSRFYLYTHQGELVGFFRFDDEFENGRLVRKHMASVMGDPKYKGGKLIETLLEQALEKERTVPIYAECDPTKPITQKYLSMGFAKKGEREELGLRVFDIELPAKQPTSKEENPTGR